MGVYEFSKREEVIEKEFSEDKKYCSNCGYILKDEKYCPSCGKSVEKAMKKYCVGCGTEILGQHNFCTKCGHKIVSNADLRFLTTLKELGKKTIAKIRKGKKFIVSVAIATIVVLIVGFSAKTVIPQLTVTSSECLAKGDYKKAYELAGGNKKDTVLIENLSAYLCVDVVDSLKDPTSFILRELWFDEEQDEMVMSVSGKNSMGGMVSNYWYYTYDKEEEKYICMVTLSDLDSEEKNYWDDTDEVLEKVYNNLQRIKVKKIIYNEKCKQDDDMVERINNSYSSNKLKDVKLLNEIDKFHKSEKNYM